jgi:hypothetical protein
LGKIFWQRLFIGVFDAFSFDLAQKNKFFAKYFSLAHRTSRDQDVEPYVQRPPKQAGSPPPRDRSV